MVVFWVTWAKPIAKWACNCGNCIIVHCGSHVSIQSCSHISVHGGNSCHVTIHVSNYIIT